MQKSISKFSPNYAIATAKKINSRTSALLFPEVAVSFKIYINLERRRRVAPGNFQQPPHIFQTRSWWVVIFQMGFRVEFQPLYFSQPQPRGEQQQQHDRVLFQ